MITEFFVLDINVAREAAISAINLDNISGVLPMAFQVYVSFALLKVRPLRSCSNSAPVHTLSHTVNAQLNYEKNINRQMCKQFAANREHCANVIWHNLLGVGWLMKITKAHKINDGTYFNKSAMFWMKSIQICLEWEKVIKGDKKLKIKI